MPHQRWKTRRGRHIPLRGGHVTRRSKDRSVLPDDLATRKNDSLVGTQRTLPDRGTLFGSEKLGDFDTGIFGSPTFSEKKGKPLIGKDTAGALG